MAARYWVGGAGTWSSTNTANWSATSGGPGGASVPVSNDSFYFDGNSGSGVVTFTDGGKTYASSNFGSAGIELQLQAALSMTSLGGLTFTAGTITTNGYSLSVRSLSSSGSQTRTLNLGSSLVLLRGSSAVALNITSSDGLTFNAGTSVLRFPNGGTTGILAGTGLNFYDVEFTYTSPLSISISGANTYNNLSFVAPVSAGVTTVTVSDPQTINGTLTLPAGTNATMRTFLRSDVLGITRTLTCAAVAWNGAERSVDFRDIAIAGAAAPISGVRLGDCGGNSGITFPAPKTVYWGSASGGNWGSISDTWALANGGATSYDNFPLAQDTAIFPSSPTPYPSTLGTITINAAYNIGTIDMSARTSDTMTLATGTNAPTIYGNWINGTGTTLTGTGTLTFAGRGSQTITSAGKTFTHPIVVNTPGGSVTLQDAFTGTNTGVNTINLFAGTFDANSYNVAVPTFGGSVTTARTAAIGSGTWTLTGNGTQVWNFGTSTNLTVTGTGTISLTSASAKTFAGGGIQTYPTINQGGAGTLTISGSNKFAGITNTAIGRVQFTGGTTNEFTAFNLNGVSGNLLQVGSTNTTQVTLKAPSWNVGANSTDAGNNTGLTFSAGSVDYLSISYVNGEIVAGPASSIYYGATNITAIYYGSTPVTSVYYGSTQVF